MPSKMGKFSVTLLLIFCASHAYSAKILGVFMTPSYSHQVVYQPIWRELSLRGHEVTVITPNPLHDSKLTNLTEIDVSASYKIFRDENEKGMLEEKSLLGEMKRFSKIFEMLAHYQLGHPDVQALIKNKNQTFDLLLVEYLYPAMYALKDIYNCPMIGITSLGLTPFGNQLIGNPKNPAMEPDITMDVSVSQTFKDRLLSAALDLTGRVLTRFVLMKKLDKLVSQYIDEDIRPMQEIVQDFSLVIVNSNLAIRNAKPSVPNLVEISGIHIQKPKPLPKDLKHFLDTSTEGVVYFSLGSNMKSALIPEEKLELILQVFAELPYKVLWKFEKENLLNRTDNVFIQKWLPQQDVLAHPNVKLFISQAGIQSIDEAIFMKVPLLLMPIFGDQPYNAHHMVTKGAALSLDYNKLNKADFKNAILEMMRNPKYQNHMNELNAIATDQIVPALEKAVWWIEYVLRHDGAKHLMYKGRNTPFYQYYMLDIIAALVISLVTIAIVLVQTTKATIKFFSVSRNYVQNKMKKTQ
ncbi:UDP-glycosyltransferase UGT5-like [Coccinella septempunctata]|uniref:UDP-glycosyltransferase UGT5-like n=1 Tax=Coccinella septempunctata TaxID=41139 RepID=UPI001D095813|nr:UDP-glycosyltransferase UGT5-like [Coccinella septempunctata]